MFDVSFDVQEPEQEKVESLIPSEASCALVWPHFGKKCSSRASPSFLFDYNVIHVRSEFYAVRGSCANRDTIVDWKRQFGLRNYNQHDADIYDYSKYDLHDVPRIQVYILDYYHF